MARPEEPQVDPGAVQVSTPPRERIYDYYIQPQRVDPSPLHDVAAALAPLSANLLALSQQQQAKKDENDKAQGEQEFWNRNSAGNAEAINNGSLPADKSKPFMEGYASQAGLNDALRLEQSIGPAYQGLDKTQSDPAAFDNWFFPQAQNSANPNLKSNPAYARSFGAGVARLHAQLSSRYVGDRSDAIKVGAQQEFTAAVGNIISTNVPQGPTTDGNPIGVDYNALGATLNEVRQMSAKAGMNKDYLDHSTIDTVVTKAIQDRDPTILQVLKTLPQDPSNPNSSKLGDIEYGSQKIGDAQNTIKNATLADRARWRADTQAADEAASKDAQRQVVQGYLKDRAYIPTQDQINAIGKVDPLFQSKLATIREGLIKGSEPVEDPQAVQQLFQRWMQGGASPRDIIDAMAAGVLTTDSSRKSAFELINTLDKYNESGGVYRITEDAGFKQYVSQIQGLTADPKWMQNVLGTPKVTPDGQKAINEFTLAAMQHSVQNPTEGPIERRKFLNDLGDAVLKGIANRDQEDFKQHAYTTPPEVQRMLPGGSASQTPTGAPGAASPAQPVLPQPGPSGNAPAGSPGPTLRDTLREFPAAPQFQQLSPTQQGQLQDAAKAMGATPQQVLEEMWKRAKGQRSEVQGGTQTADAGQPLSFDLPGGGRVDLHGVGADAAQHIQRMVSLLGSGSGLSAGEGSTSTASLQDAPEDHTASPYLKQERSWMKDELESNPELHRFLRGVLAHEQSPGERVKVMESLANRLNFLRANGEPKLTLAEYLSRQGKDQFYGPIKRGEINERWLRRTDGEAPSIDREIAAVLNGSNLIRGMTDQGSAGDPNFGVGETIHSHGEGYNDFGRGAAKAYRVAQQARVAAAHKQARNEQE